MVGRGGKGINMKLKQDHWFSKVVIFLLWVIVCALGAWALIIVRHALIGGLAVYYVQDSYPRAWQVRFIDRAYYVIAGLTYLIFIFAIEGYLKDGLPKHDVFRRFARTAGIEALLLFVGDLFTSLIQKTLLGRVSIILTVVELVVGGALFAYSIVSKPERQSYRS